MSAFPWDNSGKDDLEELQALLKETGREVTAGLPNDEEIEYS
jgi:hypothetical protein